MEINVSRPNHEHPQYARVTNRLRDAEGRPIGTANDLHILGTRMYEVEFIDGYKQAMQVNLIAENMFASVEEEGHQHLLLDFITGHRFTEEAVKKEDTINDPDLLVNDADDPDLQTIVDHTIMSLNHDNFIHCEKSLDYGEIKEKLPTNRLSPFGEPVMLRNYVDANLMHDELTENLNKPLMTSARKFCPQ